MTTVVVVRKAGQVVIAADTLVTFGDTRLANRFERNAKIFRVDTDAAEAALRAEPWIARASVRRRLPHTVVVDVVERRPAAVLAADGLYLTDAAGRPFKRVDLTAGEGKDLPIISGIPRALFTEAPDQAAVLAPDDEE